MNNQNLLTNISDYISNDMFENETKRFKVCPWCGTGSQSGTHFVVTRRKSYYLLHCFRCNHTKRINNNKVSLSDIRRLHHQRTKQVEDTNVVKGYISLPQDFTTDIPNTGLMWLSKYNISDEERVHYNIGYSPSMNRVILPVYKENRLVFWQGRRLSNSRSTPKYLNLRDASFRKSTFEILKDNDTIVLVEDILSAIAVSRTNLSAMALLGTDVSDKTMMSISHENVIIWLDPDKKVLAQQYAKRFRLLGKSARAIVHCTKDPKDYSIDETRSILNLS